jgi:two-component system sensor histidine kinase MtrB
VTLAVGPNEARIIVADRGPGLEPASLPHVFDRFYKAEPSRAARTSTSGLGLAIAAEHATLLGGKLEVAARDEGGLAFTLSLPVTHSLPGGDGSDTTASQALEMSEPTSRTNP